MITKPISFLLMAPAPPANTSGMAPRTIAPVVIRMGLKRMLAASITASVMDLPWALNWLANSTIKIPCFETRPISVKMPIQV